MTQRDDIPTRDKPLIPTHLQVRAVVWLLAPRTSSRPASFKDATKGRTYGSTASRGTLAVSTPWTRRGRSTYGIIDPARSASGSGLGRHAARSPLGAAELVAGAVTVTSCASGKFLTRTGLRLYTYDFGDNWEHTLTIGAIGDADPGFDYPRFVDGARRAPPEGVGAIPGFEEFVEALAKPKHSELKRLVEWYGRVFDSEDINLLTIKANIEKLARRRAIGKAAFAKSQRSQS
jgi:hypothetical protein